MHNIVQDVCRALDDLAQKILKAWTDDRTLNKMTASQPGTILSPKMAYVLYNIRRGFEILKQTDRA